MATQSVKDIEVSQLRSHKANVRSELGDLTELTDSIKSQGILQNIVVRPHQDIEGDYEVLMGHRRLAAAKEAGLLTVPCVVREDLSSETDAITVMLIENTQRAGITKSEEGAGYQQLIDLGMSINQVAKKVGRKHETVDSRLKLTGLSDRAKQKVDSGKATLERAMKVAEFTDYPEIQESLENNIDSFNFDWEYKRALDQKHWDEWSEKARKKLESLGFDFLTVEEIRDSSWKRVIDADLVDASPSDPEEAANLTVEKIPTEMLADEGSEKFKVVLNHGTRQVQFYKRNTVGDVKPAPASEEELAEQKARETAETALRISRATFVEHMENLLQTPKKLKGSAPVLLAYFMSRAGYKAMEYANILNIEAPAEGNQAGREEYLFNCFAECDVEQLVLALYLDSMNFSDNSHKRAVVEFSLNEGFNPHHWASASSGTRRRLAMDQLGWEETEGERLAREYWEPKLDGKDNDDKDEVNF